MSTTACSRTQKQQDQQEEEHRERTGLTPETRGVTEVSKVVAAGRGMASMGPMHSTMAHISSTDGTFPMREVTFSGCPAGISEHRQQSQADVRDVVADEAQQPMGAGLQPQVGGEITFPAPKKQGKQSKANDETVLQWFLHREPPFLR